MSDEEIESVTHLAKSYGDGSVFANLKKAIQEVLKQRPDPRDRSVVLMPSTSPRFQPPKAPVPCIMIAGGTGLAPFRSFWQALAMAGKLASGTKHLLILQQRTRKNMAFEEELLALHKSGLFDVEVIFSQDPCTAVLSDAEIRYEDTAGRQGYIDAIIGDEAMEDRLVTMIKEENAHVYICGSGGLAKTAVDALENCLCNLLGQSDGLDELELMIAEQRMAFDIFTNLKQPKIRNGMDLSELCQANDFIGTRKGNTHSDAPLLLAINNHVYDIQKLLRLHPGGDSLLKLYCGMDATTAWEAVKHDKSPGVTAMLEMFDTKTILRNPESRLNHLEKNWYKFGWRKMTMLLVEIQNALSLAFEKTWDTGTLSSADETLGEHFTVWEGEAVWRPQRSLLKGEFFADSHNRLWSVFLPMLVGESFDEIRANMNVADNRFMLRTDDLLAALELRPEHAICNGISTLIKQAVNTVAAAESTRYIPPNLQAYMEEVRNADDALIEAIKSRLIAGLQIFENSVSPVLTTFYTEFEVQIIGALLHTEFTACKS